MSTLNLNLDASLRDHLRNNFFFFFKSLDTRRKRELTNLLADQGDFENKQPKLERPSSNLKDEQITAIKSKVDEIYEKRKREILGQSPDIGTTSDPDYDIYEKRRREVLSDSIYDCERYPTPSQDQYRSSVLPPRDYAPGRGIYFI